MKFLLAVLLLLSLFCLWMILYDSTRFVIVKYQLKDSKIKKKCKAIVLADLHNKRYGKDNALLLQSIYESNPDMIFIAGDLLTATPGKSQEVAIHLLDNLKDRYPIYYANGNHEYRLKLYPETYDTMAEDYENALVGMQIKRLENEHVTLDEYGFNVYGSEIDKRFYKRFHAEKMQVEYLNDILGEASFDTFNILLAHNPDYFESYSAWGANLVLSGHVHGGVVRVPILGKGMISPSLRFFPKYDGGKFQTDTCTMILSRGLGAHTIPFRLFNPAELIELELSPKE